MRTIGKQTPHQPDWTPSGVNLAMAAEHQRIAAALAALSTTGIVKGVYRFKSHEEMNRVTDEAQAWAIAENLRLREQLHGASTASKKK